MAGRLKQAHISERLDAPGSWGVEFEDDDGGIALTIFDGSRAKEKAIKYAEQTYGSYQVFRPSWENIDGRERFRWKPEQR